MQVSKSHVVEKMASRETRAAVLQNVYLRVGDDGAYLEATDSYGLVRVPVTLDDDDSRESGYVPVDALKAARKNGGRLTLTDDTAVVAEDSYPRVDVGQYPNIPELVPEWADGVPASAGEGELYVRFGIDADILQRLASALGGKTNLVILTVQCKPGAVEHSRTTHRPVGVRSIHDPSSVGIIMPVRVDG